MDAVPIQRAVIRLFLPTSRENVGCIQELASVSCRWRAIGVLLLAALSTGCQTFGNKAIPADELPFQFRAQNYSVRPPLDLSVLASRSINTDIIYPGDVLDINLITGAETETPEALQYSVNPDGTVDLPLLGPVAISGLTLTGAEEQIRRHAVAQRIYREPLVSVLLNSRKTDKVLVVGAVNEPGPYELPRAGSDLLAAISAAKGLSEEAGREIEIRHRVDPRGSVSHASYEPGATGMQSVHIDLVEAMHGRVADTGLRDGSVVMVKEHRPAKVYVHGLVPNDGEFELPKDQPLRVTQAIALAGGRDLEFADLVHVTRFVEGYPEPVVIAVSMREAKSDRAQNLVLQAGDVVSVVETPTTFTIDFLRKFFRVGFSSTFPGI